MPKSMTAALALIAAACLPMLPMAAQAGGLKVPPEALHLARSTARTPTATPPAGYQGQWWVHPAGCRYSRAGRPGEVVWFLNAIPRGVSCPEFILQQPIDDSYRAPHMIDG
ncbi:MAG: hypothetical protein R3D85_03415 [Paracoccaceae bacterium]